ncbi:leucine-rich repeat transmembrane protein FLRT3-like [Lampetra planeri]
MLLITTEPHIMMGCISPIELILLLLVTVPTLACPSACRCNGDFVYCNDRGLTSIPSGMPRNATTLYLQNNQINNAGIPPEMRNLLKVETVYLYSNRLEEFPINLPRNVRELHLQENGMWTISKGPLTQLRKLEVLHLDDNSISTVGIEKGSFSAVPNLRLLFFSRNNLGMVPENLPKNLEELRLDDNRIETISAKALLNLSKLKHLFLDGNLLTNEGIHEKTFNDLVNLTEISFTRNMLKIPVANLPRMNLQKLFLQENRIMYIPINIFSSLKRLSFLDLSNNQLQTLPYSALNGLQGLRFLGVRNNPWYCDCKVLWLKDWLRINTVNAQGLICKGPGSNKGIHITDLPPEHFFCPATTTAAVARSHTAGVNTFTVGSPLLILRTSLPFATTKSNIFSSVTSRPTTWKDTTADIVLKVSSVSEDTIAVIWDNPFPVESYKLSLKKSDKNVGTVTMINIVSGDRTLHLFKDLHPMTLYKICLEPLVNKNIFDLDKTPTCLETKTADSALPNLTDSMNQEQEMDDGHGSVLKLAGLIGGSSVILLIVLILGICCWYSHKSGKGPWSRDTYKKGRKRESEYMESGTKKDNSILEMSENSFQIVHLNETMGDDLSMKNGLPNRTGTGYKGTLAQINNTVLIDSTLLDRDYFQRHT